MSQRRRLIVYILIGLITTAFAIAFFIRPKAPAVVVVTAAEELPDPDKDYPSGFDLSERVNRNYGLALVVVISEFSRKNADALESLRSWAKQQFQKDPVFLHAVTVEDLGVQHQSIIDSVSYNLLAVPRYVCEESILQYLRGRMASFHKTKAFEQFRSDYFDSFGLDKESALLLARYETEKADLATNVLMATGFWLLVFLAGAYVATKASKPGERSTKGQRLLAYFWFLLAAFYLSLAWDENEVPMLISAWVCLWAGIYLRRPVVIGYGEDKRLTLNLIPLSQTVIALATWATVSLVAIQFMTWLKSGSLNNPDPFMLIISSITGNFLHEPVSAKRYITRGVGLIWLLVSGWTFWQATRGPFATEVEHELASFKDTLQ